MTPIKPITSSFVNVFNINSFKVLAGSSGRVIASQYSQFLSVMVRPVIAGGCMGNATAIVFQAFARPYAIRKGKDRFPGKIP